MNQLQDLDVRQIEESFPGVRVRHLDEFIKKPVPERFPGWLDRSVVRACHVKPSYFLVLGMAPWAAQATWSG